MRVLVLWANDTIPNLGVRALAAGSKALVQRAWPDADVRIHGTGPGRIGDNDGPMNIGHVPPLLKERVAARQGLKQWVTSFDLILDTRAGDSFSDIYGRRRLLKMSVVTEFAHQWGVPVVLGPQTIGPFDHADSRALARRVLRSAAAVMVRDPTSGEVAAGLGHAPDVVSTDVVFALSRPPVERSRDVILNVSGLLWEQNPHVSAASYRKLMLDLIRTLEGEGRSVSLLAHVASHPDKTTDNDAHATREIERGLPGDREVLVPESLEEARLVLGSAAVVLGSRMHACLNALSMGTPAVPLAYSRKFSPLLEALGWPVGVDLRDPGEALPAVLAALETSDFEGRVAASLARADEAIQSAERGLRALA